MSRFLFGVIVGLLLVSLLLCGAASYTGYGIRPVGPRHMRTGSVRGPTILGGGPGVGK
jgi:hypothetical protein